MKGETAMDPSETLREMLELANEIVSSDNMDEYMAEQGDKLASKVLILHDWIKRGGFLPHQWDNS